jgi:NAD(P)-dependent dehydrogenase (short-subunit alcohol dehydrogenase family)
MTRLLLLVWLLVIALGACNAQKPSTAAQAATKPGTVLVTGANRGLGLEFARQYAEAGWNVIATARDPEAATELHALATGNLRVTVEKLDVTEQASIDALAAKYATEPIDVLINNAGVYNDRSKCAAGDDACPGDYTTQSFGNLDFALLDTVMAVNIKGPLIVSQAFYENVKASKLKKIVAISSSNGTITGELPHPWPGATFYRMSKAALNREMQIVATSVMRDGVTVVMFNPGPTLTEHQAYLRGNSMMIETSFTVGHMIDTIAKVTIDDSGKFLRYDGIAEKW